MRDNNVGVLVRTAHANREGASKSCTEGDHMRDLGDHFTPGPFDVICARGKEALCHSGNKIFRAVISKRLEEYSRCRTKLQKTGIGP